MIAAYKRLILEFAIADKCRVFNFTSGHVGAVPLSDTVISRLLHKSGIAALIAFVWLLAIESIKFVLHFIIPIRALGLVARAALRKAKSRRSESHDITVVSLGSEAVSKDAYFGILLKQIKQPFNYVKIVGGSLLSHDGYQFVEANLSYAELLKLLVMAVFSPLIYLCYLLQVSSRVSGLKQQLVFVILAMKEINKGTVLNNRLISDSLAAHLRNGKLKKILFPMEGRNWEKKLVQCANSTHLHTTSYLHCALTPRHLSLTQSGFYEQLELPTRMIAPGEMAFDLLRSIFPKVSISKGFFLRGSRAKGDAAPRKADVLLFALTGDITESEHIMSRVAGLDLQHDHKLVIRLNPNTSTYAHLAGVAKELNLSLYQQGDETLPLICFFRSSSVALDYLKADVTPVYLSLDEIISNNIFELDNKYQFESVQVDQHFSANLETIISKIGQHKINGVEAASYYLDQRYELEQLSTLLD